MKKIILLLILICQKSNAQDVVFTISKKEYIPTEIVLNDGKIISGFIKDFTLPKTIEFRGLGYDFKSIESKLNLDRTKFKFKKEINGSVEDLDLIDIKSITLKEEDTTKYEKLKLKTINSNSEVIDLKREVMIPVIKEGKINLYGLRAYQCAGPCEMMFVIAYVKKPNDEFAYIPIDFNRMNLFNLGKIDDKLFKAFEEIGKDCPEFQNYLKNNKALFEDENYRKEVKNEYKQFQKDKKEKIKQLKRAREKRRMEDNMNTEYFLKIYYNLINEYSSRCK